ncbi:hypothetical protein D6T65_00720 [Arthrobacter frigidicola]|nr:hypothetical protein D6T65_00720 [Arthrobacter frigidicola]
MTVTWTPAGIRPPASATDPERGAVSVLVAFLLVALLGFAALAVDVGAMYSEKAQLQTGADAAALAIASDCAAGACGAMGATGQFFADSNANDTSSGSVVTRPSANSVRVDTNARDAATGANTFPLFFARVLGNDTRDITATAEATWGVPRSSTTLPWTAGECVFKQSLSPSQLTQFNSTGNFVGDPIPRHILLEYHNNADYGGCAGVNGDVRGGFGWLDLDGTGCSALVDIGAGEAGSDPGLAFPRVCETILPTLMADPVLMPIYIDSDVNGSHATYTLKGFAAFQVTGYKFSGGSSLTVVDPLAPPCSGGNCRGIQGFFTRFVSLEEGMTVMPGGPNYGTTVVSLSR